MHMKKNTFINILIILLVIAILASAFFIVKISINDGKTQEKFEDPVNITVETENTDPTVPEITETVPEPTEDKSIPYDPLYHSQEPGNRGKCENPSGILWALRNEQ